MPFWDDRNFFYNYKDSDYPYNDKEKYFQTETFEVKTNDFKDADYGLWSAYMWVSPRIKLNSFVSEPSYGEAHVTFICQDGTKLTGVDSSMRFKP